jgi:hypothetical protein
MIHIKKAIRVALAEKAYAEEKAARTTRIKLRLFFIRLGINFLVLTTLSLTGYIIDYTFIINSHYLLLKITT